jgi:hypothetical protein
VQHSAEFKGRVLAAVVAGTSVLQIAKEFNIAPSTVRTWRAAAGITPVVDAEKKRDLGVQIGDYLSTGLEALTAQLRVFSDPDWIKNQPAGDLAILHGVISDKLVRVLAGLERVEEGEREYSD